MPKALKFPKLEIIITHELHGRLQLLMAIGITAKYSVLFPAFTHTFLIFTGIRLDRLRPQ